MDNFNFTKDVDLDAAMVVAAMNDGVDGVVNYAFSRRDVFNSPDEAIKRCEWLKEQSKEYIVKVSEVADQLQTNDYSIF